MALCAICGVIHNGDISCDQYNSKFTMIIENGNYYKFLKLEKEGERLHCELNGLERQFFSVKNVAERYYSMIKKVKNNQKCDKSVFGKKKVKK